MLALLEVESRLVNSRKADQETALMAATSHPDTPRALEMTHFLLGRGAHLGLRDRRDHHVLLHACLHNADVAVVDALLVWNARQRRRPFRWDDRDSQGRTASVLASELANTPPPSAVASTTFRQFGLVRDVTGRSSDFTCCH